MSENASTAAQGVAQEDGVVNEHPNAGGDSPAKANWFEVYKAEGNTLVKAEKFTEALEKYELAWEECNTDDDRAMILNNRGVVYEKQGDMEKAIETFNKALELKPAYIKVLIRRGIVYKKLQRFEDAVEDIAEAQVLAIKNSQNVAGLRDVTSELIVDYAEAELAKVTAGRTFDFPRDQIVRSYFRQFYCDPVSRIWKGLDPSPLDENDNVDLMKGFLAALDCMKNGKFSEISQHCTDEINSAGKYYFEALLLRGAINFLAGLQNEATADFKAIYDNPEASSELKSCAHLKSALLENICSTCEDAAIHFSAAEQLWSENADVYYHAALCLVDKGEAIPALALLEKGQEVCPCPKKFPLLHVMALTLKVSYDVCLSDPQEAMGRLRQLEIDGLFDVPECYEYYAQTLLLVQNTDEAFIQFDKAKEISQGEKIFDIKKIMAKQVVSNDPEATLALLKEFEDDPEIANAALYHIGEMLFMLGKREEAFEALDKSIERSFSIYDSKIRVVGKIDFLYNVSLTEKLKKHGVDLMPDFSGLRANALE